jgi:hypothetical protein
LLTFLRGWSEEGPWWPTAIPREGGKTETRTFTDLDALAEWVNAKVGRFNLYFSVNDLSLNTVKKANKEEVTRVRGLHVDVDPRAVEGGVEGKTPEQLAEHLAAERRRIWNMIDDWERNGAKLPFPRPTAIVDSGGGFQCFWRLAEEVAPEVAEALNAMIAEAMGGDDTHDVSRIMRLPGTMNLVNEKKRRRGRRDTPTALVWADWSRRFRLADFPPVPDPKAAAPVDVTARPVPVDVAALPVTDALRALIVNGHDPARWPSRSEAVFHVCCALVRAGCDDATILGVILDRDLGISAHVLDQKRPETYAQRQVARARAEVDDAFECDKDGRPLAMSQRNIRVAIRRLGVTLRHDLFAGRNLIEGLDGFGPALDDPAINRLWLMVDERFQFRPPREFFLTVVTDAARLNAYHPVAEYLAALRWDGVERIGRWLSTYGGAADTPYTRAVGELVLVAAVRRVRNPGAKFDEMLVLESPQGTNKSTALKLLATRDAWFTDDLPLNADTKRVIEALSGKWIVEAGELKGLKKGGADHLKSFLSRTHDRARLAYDRLESEVPRQCVIIGTTNDSRYLRDATGNRRFWPVKVEGFDLEALRRDRDQLWAEAAAREAEGVPIRLDPKLWADAAEEQEARRVEDPYFETLHAALGEDGDGKLRAEDAWRIVGRPSGMRTQDDNERLGDALRRLGFERKQRRFGGNPEWCYVRGDGEVRLVPEFGPDGVIVGVHRGTWREPF